ncbi:hypothetical protein RND71_004098 [Anisodus tanguticus]|uniref:FAM50A/XAP5 C-terminal domain-containing protein n=1 Tax=Anisodus tanguticus TaxID=243964 RepID=A0AAE1SX83_9SOLA|nr:hypothetical protein RND71_004098 [Anisodus tanguticus]
MSLIPIYDSGRIAETLAYDLLLEAFMHAQQFRARSLRSEEPWNWLLTEFSEYYGVTDTYSKLSEREAEEQAKRERLQKQWMRDQELIKNEPLQITYSYWDGTGHRWVIQVRKGDSIGEFLWAVQQQLAPAFREVRTTSVENILYVKEDLIIADATIEKQKHQKLQWG